MAEKKSEFERRREAFEKSYEADNWNEAIKLGDALRQDYPEQFQDNTRLINRLSSAYYNRGLAKDDKADVDEIIVDLAKAIEIKDNFFEAYRNRGVAYYRNGDYENAKADFDKAIELNPDEALVYDFRGGIYLKLGDYKNAIDDFDKAIEIDPDDHSLYIERAEAIGRLEGEKATRKIRQSYEEQLASISNPVEINKFFEKEIANSEVRLDVLRKEGKTVGETLWRKLGLVWVFCFGAFTGLKVYNLLPSDTIFLQLLSFSFSVIFLSSPFIWRLRRVNHDIRVERHALEDFRRKWIMLLLRVAQADDTLRRQHTAEIIQHFDKRGTPEVLNRLYHPKYAAPRPADDDSLLKRMAAAPKSLTERSE